MDMNDKYLAICKEAYRRSGSKRFVMDSLTTHIQEDNYKHPNRVGGKVKLTQKELRMYADTAIITVQKEESE